jgi:CheY-like chemotaxis protein
MRRDMTKQAVQLDAVVGPRPHRGAQVMVVDDDPHFRSLVRSLLEPAGITVLEAGDAREGFRCIHAHDIGVIVLDVMLPGDDGFKTLHVLKSAFPRIKVLIATALYLHNTIPLDADGVLCKSEIEHLLPLVDQLIGK